MKRIISMLLILALLLSCLPSFVGAGGNEPVIIMLGSDYQNNCYQPSYDRYYYDKTPITEQPRTLEFQAILDSLANADITPDGALFAGDYTDHFQSDGDGANCAGDGIRQIKKMLADTLGMDTANTVFAQGNHDYENAAGIAASGLQPYGEDDAYLVYVINEADFPYDQANSSFQPIVASTAQRLGEELDALANSGEDRPIMLLCHVPLHYSSRYKGKDNTYASLIFDELNDAAEDLNVFFIYGHNHSGASADYEASWGGAVNYVARGQALDVNCSGHGDAGTNMQTLNFTYLNAGYVGYSTSATNNSKTVSVIYLYQDRVTLARYDKNGEYTSAESIGQTNPLKPQEGEVTNYPITIPLHASSPYRVIAQTTTPAYGSVSADGLFVKVTPFENYAIDTWSISPADSADVTQIDNNFYFSNLTADCTFTVSFKEVTCLSAHFTDVDQTQWYHDSIDFVLRHGMFNGVSETSFEPNGTMTRAMLVTVLYRMSGSPVIIAGEHFTDVSADSWYAEAVAWGKVTGIIDGIGNRLFAPDQYVTREQTAVILYRYAIYKSLDVGDYDDLLSDFTDGSDASKYAHEALNWAIATGLLSGIGNQTLAPQGSATRAQVAAILMRFHLSNYQ